MEPIEIISQIAERGCNKVPEVIKGGCASCPIEHSIKCHASVKSNQSYYTGQYAAIEELNRRKVALWQKLKPI